MLLLSQGEVDIAETLSVDALDNILNIENGTDLTTRLGTAVEVNAAFFIKKKTQDPATAFALINQINQFQL